jgi:hypothetical protein
MPICSKPSKDRTSRTSGHPGHPHQLDISGHPQQTGHPSLVILYCGHPQWVYCCRARTVAGGLLCDCCYSTWACLDFFQLPLLYCSTPDYCVQYVQVPVQYTLVGIFQRRFQEFVDSIISFIFCKNYAIVDAPPVQQICEVVWLVTISKE